MSVTHCHDDKRCVILDQLRYLTDAYAQIRDWGRASTADSVKHFSWRQDLFHVERPFRLETNERTQKKKRQKAKVRLLRDASSHGRTESKSSVNNAESTGRRFGLKRNTRSYGVERLAMNHSGVFLCSVTLFFYDTMTLPRGEILSGEGETFSLFNLKN